MNQDLKQKTLTGMIWSLADSFANQGVQFLVGIVLARILSPREFGLIGMLAVFIAVSQSFIDSGFGNALIRKNNCTDRDYSTIFYFNIVVGALLYGILFLTAGPISQFFAEPQLKPLLQVLGISLIFSAFGMIQRTILTKNINFKIQAKISLMASLGSGIIAIILALSGFGVWSLVVLTVGRFFLTSLFLWIWNKWRPERVFCKKSFKELFGFGSRLLISGLIDTTYRNIYYMIIGKYFSAVDLGYYTRADQFNNFASQNLNTMISRVSYPVLASISEDKEKLRVYYRRLITSTMFLTFILMIGLAAIAQPLITVLLGEKWLPAVIYLQLLCFVGMFYPLHSLNLNMLQVQGRSDLFLRLEIIKKLLAVPIIVLGIIYGIKIMILAMIASSLIAFYLNSYWSGKLIGYSFFSQVRDIFPSLVLAVVIGSSVFALGHFLSLTPVLTLIVQLLTGAVLTFGISEILKLSDYLYIKEIVVGKMKKTKLKG